MTDFLDGLNPAQRSAATHIEGPIMVLAGAGSGKTRVLTYRIAHIIASGSKPYQILSLTFTNKAAKEMRARIEKIIGAEAQKIWMGTFHSIFARILRYEAEAIGYPSSFTIYDTEDSRNLVKSIIKELSLNKDIYKQGAIFSRISSFKNKFVKAEDYLKNDTNFQEDRKSGKPQFGKIYKMYADRCKQAGAMDFDDILLKTHELFQTNREVLAKYQDKFRYILVDEYQDTNKVQYYIIKQLAAAHKNLCVVGDDAQSIYAFRGASIENILNFKDDYPSFGLHKLEQNYRSTGVIVKASSDIIKNNSAQLKKEIWTANEEGEKIPVFRALSDGDEGKQVANSIYKTRRDLNLRNSDFAILYRTNSQSRSFEESLRKFQINYRIVGGLSFYQRKEIKDLLGYCRVVVNSLDEEAIKRVVNYPPRGIGNTTMEKILSTSLEQSKAIWNVMTEIESVGLSKSAGTKIQAFVAMIQEFKAQLETKDAYEMGLEIAKTSGIMNKLKEDRSIEGIGRYDNMQELLVGLKEFAENAEEGKDKLGDFMQDVALLTDADSQNDDEDKITLMTIHAAKGLEFPYVYVVGMEENLFPSQMALSSKQELEEERRLFYVALTRAEKKATLSYALSRFKWGQISNSEPSRFIDELDSTLLSFPEHQHVRTPQPTQEPGFKLPKPNFKKVTNTASSLGKGTTSNFKSSDLRGLKAGIQVEHARFGRGTVERIEGPYGMQKAHIQFNDFGLKMILLKFAKLRVIE